MYHGDLPLYDAALLAHAASDVDPQPPKNWSLFQSTTEEEQDDAHPAGYRCHVFINNRKGIIVFSHHGPALEEKAHFEACSDLSSGISSASDQPPVDYEMANEFTQSILQSMEAGEAYHHLVDFTVHHVGHALGGTHAHICGYKQKLPVMTFDSPGMRSVLQQLFGSLSTQQIKQHHTFTLNSNFFDEDNLHVGRLYRFCPDEKSEEPAVSDLTSFQQAPLFKLIAQVETHDEAPPRDPISFSNSRFDPGLRCNESEWVVSLINSGDKVFGHSMIFVEGVQDGRLYVGSFDISARELSLEAPSGSGSLSSFRKKVGVIWRIHVREKEDYEYFTQKREMENEKPYWLCTGLSFVRPVAQVQAMIHAIKQDKAHTYNAREMYENAQSIEKKAACAAQFIPYQCLSTRYKKGALARMFSLEKRSHNCASYCIEKLDIARIGLDTWNKPQKAAGGSCRIA